MIIYMLCSLHIAAAAPPATNKNDEQHKKIWMNEKQKSKENKQEVEKYIKECISTYRSIYSEYIHI